MKKKLKVFIIIFLFTFFVFFLLVRFKNIFGANMDWLNQHSIFPEYFRMLFYETKQLLPNFSFNYGAGQNIFNLSYYGLLNPLFFPAYFLPFLDMVTYMTIMSLVVIISSGLLFYKWLNNNGLSKKLSLVVALTFILTQSFIYHFHRHIMFVDYMPFLIMGLMGIDELIKNNQKSLLIFSVFLMIMTSYYYSITAFLVLGCYYLYKFFSENSKVTVKKFFQEIFKALGCMILAIALAAILLLPTALTILKGQSARSLDLSFLSLFIPNLNIFEVFDGSYTLGYSMLGFVGLLYLFFTKKKNNRLLATLIGIIFLLPIFRYILNGGLYLRSKCFIPFMPLIGLAVAIFLNDLFQKKIQIKNFIIYLIIVNGLLYYFNSNIIWNLYLLEIIALIIIYNKTNSKKIVSIVIIITCLMLCLKANSTEKFVTKDNYKEIFSSEQTQEINEILESDKSFYRMNNLENAYQTVNKIYDINYLTTNLYSSTYNTYYLNFVRDIFKNNIAYNNYFLISATNNNLFNIFMGVKYLYSNNLISGGYQKLSDNLYVNYDVYPLGFANSNLMSETSFEEISYPYNIEYLFNNIIVDKEVSTKENSSHIEEVKLDFEITEIDKDKIQINKGENGYQIKALEDTKFKLKLKTPLNKKVLFINLYGLKRPSKKDIYLNINNVSNLLTYETWTYDNKNEVFHYVLTDDLLDELEISLGKGVYDIENIETYTLDFSYLNNYRSNLDEFIITNYQNDTITGNIDVTKDGYFMMTIPYDEGLEVVANGVKQKLEIVDKTFIGFPIKKGSYEIKITYKTPGLKAGLIISSASFLIFFGILGLENKEKIFKISKKNKSTKEKMSNKC